MILALQMDRNDSIPANGCATRVSVLRRAGAESHVQDQYREAQEHDIHLEHASNGRAYASVSDWKYFYARHGNRFHQTRFCHIVISIDSTRLESQG